MDWLLDAIDKSLLLLFFRKEGLSCLFSLSLYLGSYQKRTPSSSFPKSRSHPPPMNDISAHLVGLLLVAIFVALAARRLHLPYTVGL
ncbi:MAG TPA: hypothetical protein VMB71_02055, partial [Acetobacteraceae bacterium]|nr:hypothetical protein [Acetobacteraceae bacterium]